MAPDERLWRYRISIYSVQVRDEGEFTCATPRGHSNSVRIIVRSIDTHFPIISLKICNSIWCRYSCGVHTVGSHRSTIEIDN